MLPVTALALLAVLLRNDAGPQDTSPPTAAPPLRANYLIMAADDFVVDVYLNGKLVPDSKRTLLEERFGATVERVDVPVHRGDWLVFNAVNNRMRWGGAHYFGMAGCFAPNEFGFVSDRASRQWSACDNPGAVSRFIARKNFENHSPVQVVDNAWADGDALMRQHAGQNWSGTPVWGKARNTWLKVVLE